MIVSINGVWCSDARIAENTVPEAVSRIHPLSANTSPDRSIYGWSGCGITLCASSSHCCVCAVSAPASSPVFCAINSPTAARRSRSIRVTASSISSSAPSTENSVSATRSSFCCRKRCGSRRAAARTAQAAAASHQLRIRFISALLSEGMTRAFPRRPRSQSAGSTHGPRRSSGTASGRGPRRPPLWRAIYPPYKTDR